MAIDFRNLNKLLLIVVLFFPLIVFSDPCAPIREQELECNSYKVDLFRYQAGSEVIVRSNPIPLQPDRFAVACCIDSRLEGRFWLVKPLSVGTIVEESVEYCRVPSLGSVGELQSYFNVDGDEFQAFEFEKNAKDMILEIRSSGDVDAGAANLCGTLDKMPHWNLPDPKAVLEGNDDFSGWKKIGSALILQIQIWSGIK